MNKLMPELRHTKFCIIFRISELRTKLIFALLTCFGLSLLDIYHFSGIFSLIYFYAY